MSAATVAVVPPSTGSPSASSKKPSAVARSGVPAAAYRSWSAARMAACAPSNAFFIERSGLAASSAVCSRNHACHARKVP